MLETEEHYKHMKKERDRANTLWKLFAVSAGVLLLGVPLPPLQPWVAFSGAGIFVALMGHFVYRAKRLPMREALLLGQLKQGQLTVSILCIELELNPAEAKVLLYKMERNGLIQVDEDALYEEGDMIYRLKGYKALQ